MSSRARSARCIARRLGAAFTSAAFGILLLVMPMHTAAAGGTPPAGATAPPPIARLAPAGVAASHPEWQTIELHRNGAVGEHVAVTVGIPFPPGMLHDAGKVRIEDAGGQVVPAHVEQTLLWHFEGGGIRAVRAQFHTTLAGDHARMRFAIVAAGDAAPGTSAPGWPYAQGLVDGPDGVRVPGVLATLTPQWMSASLIAGPQVPAVPTGAYDRYFETQFAWAGKLPRTDGSAWLFDRPTTLFQQYVRTGRADYLAAAVQSYHFYMAHIRRLGAPGWPLCGGGFQLGDVNPCDPKYVYIEPTVFALGVAGDDSYNDPDLIQRMVGSWDTGGWNIPAGAYTGATQRFFTERQTGLGLLQIVSAWELTGKREYLRRIDDRLGWLYQHQQHNPDGLGNDGSWRNSWDMHEGNSYDAATDVPGSSPWMTQNIIDGLWHAWLVTGDSRIPVMITAFGRYLERYGWIDAKTVASVGKDWRDPCSGPGGQISWYWSSAHADRTQLIAIENSDGWYSDSHNVELTLPVAAARYFSTDPSLQQALDRRLQALASSYNQACAENRSTARRFNWNNRGTGVVQWLTRRPAGSGAALETAPRTKP